MRVLIACEKSGVVRRAFRERGHDAWSCDIEPADDESVFHLQCDVRAALADRWDLMIAHPPCTYLSASGLHWNRRRPARNAATGAALEFVRLLMAAPVCRIAIENPIGRVGSQIRKANQYIQPYEFGHDASKKTGLWLKNLPALVGTEYIEPRIVMYSGKPRRRWSNQTDSGQNRLPPAAGRAAERSKTYSGIAAAMADQWGNF